MPSWSKLITSFGPLEALVVIAVVAVMVGMNEWSRIQRWFRR